MIPKNAIQEIKHAHPGYVAHWVYHEHGMPTMIVVRYNNRSQGEKKDKFFVQWCLQDGKWVQGVLPGELPLFGLQSLCREKVHGSILIVGGEKCAAALHQLGIAAVTNPLGESSVERADFSPLRIFKRFIILRDNDATGIKFARLIAAQLLRLVEDAEIFVCNLTPEIAKGDVVDWMVQYPLRGHQWDGFKPLSVDQISCVKQGLCQEVEKTKFTVQDCPDVKFKPEHMLFNGEPLPFEDKLLPVPPFPLDCLPPPLRQYSLIRAEQMCLPPDFTATAFIGVISGLIGRSFQLEMRPGRDWIEVANLWGLIIGNPASLKSPTIKSVSSLMLTPLDTKAKNVYLTAMQNYKMRAKEAKANKVDLDEPEPTRQRYHTDDPTVASLKKLFSGNPRGILLRSDEASGQLKKFDKDGCEGDRSFYLSCWSGQELYHDDRMTRESLLDLNLCLSWIGGIQPNALKQHLQEATGTGKGSDGLMQRFQLISYPDINQEFKDVDVMIPPELKAKITQMTISLDNVCTGQMILRFDPEAQQRFVDWYVKHQNTTRAEEEEYWQSHLGKIPKLIGSLCIQLHLLDNLEKGPIPEEISLSVFEKALCLIEYYIAHARRAYGSIESRVLTDAKKILKMIRSGKVASRFRASEIYQKCSCPLRDPEKTHAALGFLREYNIVAEEKRTGGLGRSAAEWIVHPALQKR